MKSQVKSQIRTAQPTAAALETVRTAYRTNATARKLLDAAAAAKANAQPYRVPGKTDEGQCAARYAIEKMAERIRSERRAPNAVSPVYVAIWGKMRYITAARYHDLNGGANVERTDTAAFTHIRPEVSWTEMLELYARDAAEIAGITTVNESDEHRDSSSDLLATAHFQISRDERPAQWATVYVDGDASGSTRTYTVAGSNRPDLTPKQGQATRYARMMGDVYTPFGPDAPRRDDLMAEMEAAGMLYGPTEASVRAARRSAARRNVKRAVMVYTESDPAPAENARNALLATTADVQVWLESALTRTPAERAETTPAEMEARTSAALAASRAALKPVPATVTRRAAPRSARPERIVIRARYVPTPAERRAAAEQIVEAKRRTGPQTLEQTVKEFERRSEPKTATAQDARRAALEHDRAEVALTAARDAQQNPLYDENGFLVEYRLSPAPVRESGNPVPDSLEATGIAPARESDTYSPIPNRPAAPIAPVKTFIVEAPKRAAVVSAAQLERLEAIAARPGKPERGIMGQIAATRAALARQ